MDDCCESKAGALETLALQGAQRRVLTIVLAMNATMFVVEFSAGVVAGSASLMADAVDMLGDAVVCAPVPQGGDNGGNPRGGAACAKAGTRVSILDQRRRDGGGRQPDKAASTRALAQPGVASSALGSRGKGDIGLAAFTSSTRIGSATVSSIAASALLS